MKKSFYEILEVSTSASQETIDAVYLVLQKKYSPDAGEPSAAAAEQLKFIHIAYGVIADPVKRAVYDKRLAKASAEQAPVIAPPETPPAAPAPSAPAAPVAEKDIVATPIDLIAQLKEANRNKGPREDLGERIFAVATKPLFAAVIGLVFVGSVTYKFMNPAPNPTPSPAFAKQGPFSPDPLAAAALDTAQKLSVRVEADISHKEYSTAVADLAARTKTYLASAPAGKNPRLAGAVEKLLDAHVKARDIWAIKDEQPGLFADVETDNSSYRKVLSIYPLAAQIAKPLDDRGQRVKLDMDAVLNALWQDARRAFNDAKRFNSGTT